MRRKMLPFFVIKNSKKKIFLSKKITICQTKTVAKTRLEKQWKMKMSNEDKTALDQRGESFVTISSSVSVPATLSFPLSLCLRSPQVSSARGRNSNAKQSVYKTKNTEIRVVTSKLLLSIGRKTERTSEKKNWLKNLAMTKAQKLAAKLSPSGVS